MFRTISRRFLAVVAMAVAFAAPSTSHALSSRCVATSQELAAALKEASASTDAIFLIKIRTGIYAPTAQTGPFQLLQQHSGQIVEISGGWNGSNGACDTASHVPSQSAIIGNATTPALTVYAGVAMSFDPADQVTNAQVFVHDLMLKNPYFTEYSVYNPDYGDSPELARESESACLNGLVGGATNALQFERLDIRYCYAPNNGEASGRVVNVGGQLTMRDISARSGKALYNAGMMVDTRQGGVSNLAHLSVLDMQTATRYESAGQFYESPYLFANGLDVRATYGGAAYLSNSVIWGDNDAGSSSLAVFGAVTDAPAGFWENFFSAGVFDFVFDVDDILDGSEGQVVVADSYARSVMRVGIGNTPTLVVGVDPRFVAANDPRLLPDSPLINAGLPNPPGGSGSFDASGRTRTIGAGVDVGAFEFDPANAPANQAPILNISAIAGTNRMTVPASTALATDLTTFTAFDDGLPAPATLDYTLQSLTTKPAGRENPFAFFGDGTLRLIKPFPQDQTTVYTLVVRVCDGEPLCDFETFTLTALTPNKAPQLALLSQYAVAALAPAGTLVFGANASDDGQPDPLSYTLSGGCAGSGIAAIDPGTGKVSLLIANPPLGGSCDATVTASDGQYTAQASTQIVLQAAGDDTIFRNGFQP